MYDLPTNDRRENDAIPIDQSGPDDTLYGVPTEGMAMEGEDDVALDDTLSSLSVENIGSKDIEDHINLNDTALPEKKEEYYSLEDDKMAKIVTSGEALLADDMLGETKAASGEAFLEEIEEDVDLDDTFGSGSGLLDLSLQADDTSLGSILDEIYTSEGETAHKRESHPKTKSTESKDSNNKQTIKVLVGHSLLSLLKSVRTSQLFNRRKPAAKAEKWLLSLSFWIPRKYREPISGDILEDCHELRQLGYGEWRVRAHVLWQFTIAVIMLWPEAIVSAIGTAIRKILNTRS